MNRPKARNLWRAGISSWPIGISMVLCSTGPALGKKPHAECDLLPYFPEPNRFVRRAKPPAPPGWQEKYQVELRKPDAQLPAEWRGKNYLEKAGFLFEAIDKQTARLAEGQRQPEKLLRERALSLAVLQIILQKLPPDLRQSVESSLQTRCWIGELDIRDIVHQLSVILWWDAGVEAVKFYDSNPEARNEREGLLRRLAQALAAGAKEPELRKIENDFWQLERKTEAAARGRLLRGEWK